ncbi:retinol dehydrogenase 12, partial [Aureobasidium melanogenum]|uniref:Retinol dehydrogenase 12 n=1 Tax=Aureobasidium melanogenum (strain CBS 110374) TaxID=1043003 RepID=A0A074VH54_AURM1
MGYAATFLRSQLFTKLPYPNSSFAGQTVIVTGSNTGLGLEAARHIARLEATKVILACRTVTKGQAAAADITASEHLTSDHIEVWELNLSSYESIRAFAQRVQRLDRLDAFIQNAGILTTEYRLEEGEESTITINVTSATLLGLSVLPKLRESANKFGVRGRLTFVGSDLQYIAKFKEAETTGSLYAALNNKEGVDMDDRYKVSKLLLLYTVREMAARSPMGQDSNVIIDYVTPGACKSDLFRDDASWIQKLIMNIMIFIIARTTEQGSRTLVHAASPDISTNAHGAFLMDCQVFPNGDNVDSEKGRKMQKRFTEELFAKLETIHPGITSCL